MGNGLIDDGGLSVLVQVVRAVVFTQGTLGGGAMGERGGGGKLRSTNGVQATNK